MWQPCRYNRMRHFPRRTSRFAWLRGKHISFGAGSLAAFFQAFQIAGGPLYGRFGIGGLGASPLQLPAAILRPTLFQIRSVARCPLPCSNLQKLPATGTPKTIQAAYPLKPPLPPTQASRHPGDGREADGGLPKAQLPAEPAALAPGTSFCPHRCGSRI